jgi:pepF/M3 family oligoendopeptidase
MTSNPDDIRWQLESLYSGLDGADYRAARADLERRISELAATLDEQGIGAGAPLADSAEQVPLLARLIDDLNALYGRYSDISVFLAGFTAVDAFNDQAQGESSTLRLVGAKLAPLEARLTAWIGRFDPAAFTTHPTLVAHAHLLARRRVSAQHLMSDTEEGLAAALSPSAGDAWAKLHTDLISKVSIEVALPGSEAPEEAGLARLRVLQGDPDRGVREAAFRAELALLEAHKVAFAAAMNGVKGEVATLSDRRGWGSALDEALFQNGITPGALDALQTAVREAFPDLRRYLLAKARFLGRERLAWFDLLAPVEVGAPQSFSFAEASDFIIEHFTRFDPALAALARRAFSERWIDVLPRAGKRNGAFCMGTPGAQESRVMLNFGGGLDDVFTLAHELGHAFHNDALYRAGRLPLQAGTPMTLAETASIFCETLVTNALLSEADDATRLAVLEQDLRGAAQLVLDIDSRFRIEQAIFAARRGRDLSVAELDTLMLEAQAATYGDVLESDARHPRMWAQKGHYYSARRSFYNFPYTFGYLFGLGVYARYRAEGPSFAARYEALLSRTGMASVADLGREFGIEVEATEFWRGALALTRQRVDDYEQLVDRYRGAA